MKKFSKNSTVAIIAMLVVSFALGLVGINTASAASQPPFGALGTYGVVATTHTNANTSPYTIVNGDVCATGHDVPLPLTITGSTITPCADAIGTDQANAMADLNSQAGTCTTILTTGGIATNNLNEGDIGLGAGIYTTGCYKTGGAMNVAAGTVTLTGDGTFIFKSGGALTTEANTKVVLAGGASADKVFWIPAGGTTIGAYTGSLPPPITFVGNIFKGADGSGITLGHFANLLGRTLAFGSTVTTSANIIGAVATTHLTLVKTITNDNGGTANATAWTLAATGPTLISGATGSGTVTDAVVISGTYVLSESGPAGYTASTYSCVNNGGAAVVSNSITLAAGDDATCTINNNDIAPQLKSTINVVKVVINDSGRAKTIADFPLFVNGLPVVSGTTNIFPANITYMVTETADANYTRTFSGDCDSNGQINLIPGNNRVCIITNNDIALAVSATSTPPIPPLIDVVKVPSPLALPNGPGAVTYTYTLRNVGMVPVTDITMVGDTCSPIILVSGDTNNDAKLDVSETWVHTCSTTLSATHTNTVTATGWANGISAVDIASATVVVGAPVVPPLIHLVKKPSVFTLPAGGGNVTYTYTVTNPGTEPLSNVSITDDKCTGLPGRVSGHPGDINKNDLLESNETWSFTCQSNLTQTTTNTGTASGEANGLIARDFAIATVVVAATVPTPIVPKLPNTGIAPMENPTLWPIVAAGSLAILFLLYVIRKKQIIY